MPMNPFAHTQSLRANASAAKVAEAVQADADRLRSRARELDERRRLTYGLSARRELEVEVQALLQQVIGMDSLAGHLRRLAGAR